MRRIKYVLWFFLCANCFVFAGQSTSDSKVYKDRKKAPSIEFYGIDQTENVAAAKWQSENRKYPTQSKNYLPIVRVPAGVINNVEGWAILTFTVDEKGNTTNIKIIDEEPKGKFSKEVKKAISRFKFQPYSPDGAPKKIPNVWHTFEFSTNTVMPVRSADSFQKTMAKNKGRLFELFNSKVKNNLPSKGNFAVSFSVDSSGVINELRLIKSELENPNLDLELLDAFREINFGSEKVSETKVTYIIDFLDQ